MAEGDLCTVEYVKNKGGMQGTLFDNIIIEQITTLSEEIRFDITGDIEDRTLSSLNLNAKRACAYAVLKEMESQKLISSTKNTTSQREGNISVDYESGTKDTSYKLDLSYSDEYERYMARLRPMPPIGGRI